MNRYKEDMASEFPNINILKSLPPKFFNVAAVSFELYDLYWNNSVWDNRAQRNNELLLT
jgi:hypothetical protein